MVRRELKNKIQKWGKFDRKRGENSRIRIRFLEGIRRSIGHVLVQARFSIPPIPLSKVPRHPLRILMPTVWHRFVYEGSSCCLDS